VRGEPSCPAGFLKIILGSWRSVLCPDCDSDPREDATVMFYVVG